ncbi:MAG: recombinase family protein [Xanthobacteraceae bacterium]
MSPRSARSRPAITRGSLAHLLRNRFYIGKVAFKGEVLKGEQPAIVDETLFEAVEAKLNAAARAGSVRCVPASAIEVAVVQSVRDHLKPSQPTDDRSLINTHVARVEVQPDQLLIGLAEGASTLEIPWRKLPARRHREILLPEGIHPEHARPIRSETRARLVASIARGRRWLDELVADPTASADSIAKRENCSARKINMTISLAFLAPDLVKAAIDGRLSHGVGVARLTDLPAEWSRQHQMLGLPAQ